MILCSALGSAAQTTGSAPTVAESAGAAVRTLQQAATALRSASEPGFASLELDYAGELAWLNQGPMPSQPMRFDYRQQTYFGAPDSAVLVRLEFSGPESSFERRAALTGSAGSAALVELASHSPHAVVRQLLSEPRNLALIESSDDFAIVAGSLYGRRVEVSLGPDRRLAALRYPINDELHGDSVRLVEYFEYFEQAGALFPRLVRQSDGGRTTHSLTYRSASMGHPAPDWGEGLAPQERPAGGEGLSAVALSNGIYLLQQHGGQDYHGMLVELDEGLMVLEAPAIIGDGRELARIARSVSPKPVRYVVPTHHHDDHSAGAAVLAHAGATILATPGNVDFFRTMATSPRWIALGGGAPAQARVRALGRDEQIGPVRFIDIGSASHAREHLVFYFPDHGLLFHSDMGRFNADGSVEPARRQTCHLLAQIEARGLRVDRILSGHGRAGTMEDLRRAVAHPQSACRR